MSQSYKVTIYITNYNYESYVRQAIESVLNQSFQDFELIIIDDGSTDNSKSIIKEYENRDRVQIIFQQNKGLNASNNVAIQMSKGEYIVRLDADDYFEPHAIETMVKDLEADPKLALVFPDYRLVDSDGENIGEVHRHDFSKDVSLLDQPAHGACTMIRKSILEKVGGYDESFKCQDGYDIWLKIATAYPVRNVSQVLFSYRQHSSSITRNEERLLHTRAQIKAKFVKNKGLPKLNILTVIPVRGSETDPKSLPLRQLGEKKLIDWTLESASKSQLLSDIVVTTPTKAVRDHVNKHYQNSQVTVRERSAELAKVNFSATDTILDALSHYEETHKAPDAVLILYVESPFRSHIYIDKAIHTLQIFDVDMVDGVRPDNGIYYKHDGHGLQPLHPDTRIKLERHDLYKRCGSIHLIRRQTLIENKKLMSGQTGHIILDQKAAFKIQSELDWNIALHLAQN